jgi:hypothetical protein
MGEAMAAQILCPILLLIRENPQTFFFTTLRHNFSFDFVSHAEMPKHA